LKKELIKMYIQWLSKKYCSGNIIFQKDLNWFLNLKDLKILLKYLYFFFKG